jgi:antitoxin component YwqK of YwqJK toxin-antitoxin module
MLELNIFYIMRRLIIMFLLMFISIGATAQKLSSENPIYIEGDLRYELISAEENNVLVFFQMFTDSKVLQEGYYKNGKRDGMWKMYNYRGDITSVMHFDMGERVKLEITKRDKHVTVFYENNKPIKHMTVAYLN